MQLNRIGRHAVLCAHSSKGKDRKGRERNGRKNDLESLGLCIFAGMGALLVPATDADAQIAPIWTERAFIPGSTGTDSSRAIVHWKDPVTSEQWVYVVGTMRNTIGANVVATIKYKVDLVGGTQEVERRYYPHIPDINEATGTHNGIDLDVDPVTGDIYVLAEELNASGDYDYVTIKYDKLLVPSPSWINFPTFPEAVRRFDGGGHDRPVDIDFVGDADEAFIPSIAVTGTTYGGGINGKDVMSVLYRASDGGLDLGRWPDNGDDDGYRRYHHSLGDRVVGIQWGYESIAQGEAYINIPVVYIAGTQYEDAQRRYDIFAMEYWSGGGAAPLFGGGWDGPAGGSDFATGICVDPVLGSGLSTNYIAVIGYSPHYDPPGSQSRSSPFGAGTAAATPMADTDYIILNVDNLTGDSAWTLGTSYYGMGYENLRMWSGSSSSSTSDDISADVDIGYHSVDTDMRNAWITGRVRNPLGTDYDIGTIYYDLNSTIQPKDPVEQWITTLTGTSREGAVAIDVLEYPQSATARYAYVAAWSLTTSLDLITLQYEIGVAPFLLGVFDAAGGSDAPAGIVAYGTLVPLSNRVFVTGESHTAGTNKDFITLRYQWP